MKFLNLFIFLFLLPHAEVSCSSSCEELQNIIHNLPGTCGDKNYQFNCEGNNPIFCIRSNTFIVKDISFQNTTFRLVDPSYSVTGDHCHLPNFTWDDDYVSSDFFETYSSFLYIHFVNCTQEIYDDTRYVLIPCQNISNSRVYAVYYGPGRYYVSDLHDSCSLVGSTLIDDIGKHEHIDSAAIMKGMETGVLVNWTSSIHMEGDSLSCSVLPRCWKNSIWYMGSDLSIGWKIINLLLWEPWFLDCVYSASLVSFCFMLILLVLLDVILIILFTRIILAPLAILSFLLFKWWKMSSTISSIEKFLRKNELLHIRRYDFIEISIMTNHFREKLGQGGFGTVYKGRLLNSQQVAVKILSNPIGDGDDFISEVATIGRIHHTNIVRLIGFCSEGSKRALVYAYMPNGSLDKYIFSPSNNALSMEKRREIAIGIARGIDYLHRGCEMQILHFDIKPHNILLDQNLIPKISDFGLAKLYPKDYSLVTLSMARGTIGYIAPELISRTFGAVSYKADVYSFGMLLMEMVSGRRNVNNHAESSGQVYYPSWIYDQLNLPVDPHNLSSNVEKFGEIEERLYKVALWCIQMKASNRPTMTRVIEMLQNDANNLEMPPRPSMICTPHELSVGPSENESCNIELSLISEEISML